MKNYKTEGVVRFSLAELIRHKGKGNIYSIVSSLPKYPGSSYILNYSRLLKEAKGLKYASVDLVNYIVLASFRDYYRYTEFRDSSLDLSLSPLTGLQVLENPLLDIREKRIIFLLENRPAEQ